jgi:hypothetical protein
MAEKQNQDINTLISDEAVIVDALTLKNKMLMVQVAQLQARVAQLETEAANAKPKPKRSKKS